MSRGEWRLWVWPIRDRGSSFLPLLTSAPTSWFSIGTPLAHPRSSHRTTRHSCMPLRLAHLGHAPAQVFSALSALVVPRSLVVRALATSYIALIPLRPYRPGFPLPPHAEHGPRRIPSLQNSLMIDARDRPGAIRSASSRVASPMLLPVPSQVRQRAPSQDAAARRSVRRAMREIELPISFMGAHEDSDFKQVSRTARSPSPHHPTPRRTCQPAHADTNIAIGATIQPGDPAGWRDGEADDHRGAQPDRRVGAAVLHHGARRPQGLQQDRDAGLGLEAWTGYFARSRNNPPSPAASAAPSNRSGCCSIHCSSIDTGGCASTSVTPSSTSRRNHVSKSACASQPSLG